MVVLNTSKDSQVMFNMLLYLEMFYVQLASVYFFSFNEDELLQYTV